MRMLQKRMQQRCPGETYFHVRNFLNKMFKSLSMRKVEKEIANDCPFPTKVITEV